MATDKVLVKRIEGFDERVGACAFLLRDEKPAKVKQIAESRGVTEDIAARMYVVGALKASIRRGTSNNYSDALDRFESDQVGDRQVSVSGEAPICREVRRINAINETRAGKGTSHRRNMGKVLGTIYVEYDASVADNTVDVVFEHSEYDSIAIHIDSAIGAYIDEYVTRLSKTAKASIRAIIASRYSEAEIMAGKDEGAYKLMKSAKYLHHNFPKADAITTRELIVLLRKYAA